MGAEILVSERRGNRVCASQLWLNIDSNAAGPQVTIVIQIIIFGRRPPVRPVDRLGFLQPMINARYFPLHLHMHTNVHTNHEDPINRMGSEAFTRARAHVCEKRLHVPTGSDPDVVTNSENCIVRPMQPLHGPFARKLQLQKTIKAPNPCTL